MDDHNLLGLLNGIASQCYYHEEGITDELLRCQYYPDLPQDRFQQLMERLTQLMRSMASSNMDFSQLEAFLISQMKHREGSKITEQQASTLKIFWKNNKTRIHEAIVKYSTFNNTLEKFNWRVDMPTQSKASPLTASTPVAILQMKLKHNNLIPNKVHFESLQFELDDIEVTKLLKSMEEIDEQLKTFTKTLP